MNPNPAIGYRVALEERCTGGLAHRPTEWRVAGRKASQAEHDSIRRAAVAFEACDHAQVNGVHVFYCTAVVPFHHSTTP
jgi:hypothetical protein